jgi:Flp pilus assembly protein TadG
MMKRLRKPTKHCDGQALVEFALLVPLLIIIVLGIVEFGRIWMTMQVLSSAAREGARVAAVTAPTVGLVEDAVENVLTAAGYSEPSITVLGPSSEGEVTVTVQIVYTVITGSIVPGLSGTMTLSRSAVMHWEG